MRWPPSRATCLLLLAIASAGYFLVGSIVGTAPDGAWLGFSAAIWAAWDNEVIQERRRRQRRTRRGRRFRHAHEVPRVLPEVVERELEIEDEDDEEETR